MQETSKQELNESKPGCEKGLEVYKLSKLFSAKGLNEVNNYEGDFSRHTLTGL